ncbi:hypothetical protein ACCO45_007101 [Purpureocillium lilacinum]|uniref:Uncharacterized protein n=1 Tax=Purpureocillium lilacinum TaxID=33203 RepID=A0ACC4DRI6_PURLI
MCVQQRHAESTCPRFNPECLTRTRVSRDLRRPPPKVTGQQLASFVILHVGSIPPSQLKLRRFVDRRLRRSLFVCSFVPARRLSWPLDPIEPTSVRECLPAVGAIDLEGFPPRRRLHLASRNPSSFQGLEAREPAQPRQPPPAQAYVWN